MGKYVKKVCNWRVLQVLQNSDKMGLKNPEKKKKRKSCHVFTKQSNCPANGLTQRENEKEGMRDPKRNKEKKEKANETHTAYCTWTL